ncbi:sugar transferase [Pedobacter gandavensis]|uniref:sugar transferase n=1 Tax=Pedobacter gandavensis TaxID=2679963 RepID=UPI002930E615|nr:sugar transferase [Pedobacter gandavensis]
MKRIFDIFVSFLGIIILSPIFIILIIIIKCTSKGGAFYRQIRVGQHNQDFGLLKFRSMYVDSDKMGLLTVGNQDRRITPIGVTIRKFKLDELPQLFNVLFGQMSLVGPRPEVRKYVNLYKGAELKVLDLKPGITDYASIKYRNENDILQHQGDPEKYYIEVIMPDKIRMNLSSYEMTKSVSGSIKIIILTIRAVFFSK